MQKTLTIFITLLYMCASLQAQIDGDKIFQNDQVITIELEFSQVSFYDSLVLNYETATYMKADLTLTDASGSTSFSDVGVRFKGNSTFNHPGNKKAFKIDFNEYISGQNYDGLKKLNFSNGFKDPSLMREKIFFDMCQDAGVPAPRANFANVYFNGTLWGFYTVVEQIDDQFLDWRILDDDGNLFKAGDNFGGGPGGGGNAADLVDYGPDQTAYAERYELKSNEDENDWTDLIELIDFINNSSATDFENELGNHIELEAYIRSVALDNLFSNLDSYTGSARNYYLYHNLTTNKWEWIKWDGNESFGSYGGGGGPGGGLNMLTLPLDHHDNDRPLLENLFASPTLYAQYEDEVCYLIGNFFNPASMNPKIDALKSLIQSSVYADGNKQYTNANFDDVIEGNITTGGGPGGGTVYGIKSFIQAKNNYVTGLLDCSGVNTENELESVVSTFPNPFHSSVIVDLGSERFHSISIYDNLGRVVYEEEINGASTIELNLSFLENGIYFGQLNNEKSNGNTMFKLVKE